MRKTIAKSIGIGIMLILSIAIVALSYYSTIVPSDNISAHYGADCKIDKGEVPLHHPSIGWQMDTLWHPTEPNRFNVALSYYQEIEYIIDTVEVIEEDGVRWYTLDTLVYE